MMLKEMIKDIFGIETEEMESVSIYGMDPDNIENKKTLLVNDDNVVTLDTIETREFDAEALALVVEEAEAIWDIFHKHVTICILMNRNRSVLVKEMSIKSEADFTIKLAHQSFSNPVLSAIRDKIMNGMADQEDKEFLEVLPMLVGDEDRQAIRAECFELLSMM